MTSAGEIEKRFRNNPELFTLKKHEAAKSDAWNYFSLLFEKQGADSGSLTEVKYLCVCNACKHSRLTEAVSVTCNLRLITTTASLM